MTTRKITINRSDWSGRMVDVEILAEDRFSMLDCTFQLVKLDPCPDLPELEIWRIYGDDWPADHVLGTVDRWRSESFNSQACGIERDASGTDPDGLIKAAAQLLCNTI
jgi:hypothetical protein